MAKVLSTIKATLTRLIFSAHSIVAVWQVVQNKSDNIYWTLCCPLLLLLFEGIFTIFIKKTQEWRWFCPSVFLYLASIVPAIWLLELDKVKRRLLGNKNTVDENVLIPEVFRVVKINTDTWITLIEQFLMLILIVGRWLLPKGDLTRDQLSQILLVYIGTAADIIEFFDSYKDDSIAKIPLLVNLTLGIWSWSLLQFTIVLSATRARKSRSGGGTLHRRSESSSTECCDSCYCCCGIDVWGIVLNVILQDVPFLTFRLLIIIHYEIISYMNVFFTCKNSLVIVLQLYRLYVVNAEFWDNRREQRKLIRSRNKTRSGRRRQLDADMNGIYMICTDRNQLDFGRKRTKRRREHSDEEATSAYAKKRSKKDKHLEQTKSKTYHKRKDTGYSTASSQNLYVVKQRSGTLKEAHKDEKKKPKRHLTPEVAELQRKAKTMQKMDKNKRQKTKRIEAVIEESTNNSSTNNSTDSTYKSPLPRYDVVNEQTKSGKKIKRTHAKRMPSRTFSLTNSVTASSSSTSTSSSTSATFSSND